MRRQGAASAQGEEGTGARTEMGARGCRRLEKVLASAYVIRTRKPPLALPPMHDSCDHSHERSVEKLASCYQLTPYQPISLSNPLPRCLATARLGLSLVAHSAVAISSCGAALRCNHLIAKVRRELVGGTADHLVTVAVAAQNGG